MAGKIVSAHPDIDADEYAILSAVCVANQVPMKLAWAEGLRMFVKTLPVQLDKQNSGKADRRRNKAVTGGAS